MYDFGESTFAIFIFASIGIRPQKQILFLKSRLHLKRNTPFRERDRKSLKAVPLYNNGTGFPASPAFLISPMFLLIFGLAPTSPSFFLQNALLSLRFAMNRHIPKLYRLLRSLAFKTLYMIFFVNRLKTP